MLLISLEEALESEETSEWVGFVKTMKIFIQKKFNMNNAMINDKLDKMGTEMKADIKRLEAGQAKIDGDIKEIKAGQVKMEAEIKGEIVVEMMSLDERFQ